MAKGTTRRATLPIIEADVDVTAQLALDTAATGGGMFTHVAARVSGNNNYLARVKYLPDGVVWLHLMRTAGGTSTTLVGGTVAGLTAQPGQMLNLRFQVSGTAPTTVRAKLWAAGTDEPAAWTRTFSDTNTGVAAAGGLYVECYLSSTATATTTQLIDNLKVVKPE